MRSWGIALRLLIGIVTAWLLGWGFVEVGEEISSGLLPRIDRWILKLVAAEREPDVTASMLMLTYLGSEWACVPISIVVAAVLWTRGRRLISVMTVLALVGASLVSLALKYAYNRPRPDISPLVEGAFSSFPSGHTLTATAFYGFLAYVAVRSARWYWKVAAGIAYVALVLGIGVSRVYLGIHWPSDVIGGMLAGLAWLAACISAYETLLHARHHRRLRAGEKDSGTAHV